MDSVSEVGQTEGTGGTLSMGSSGGHGFAAMEFGSPEQLVYLWVVALALGLLLLGRRQRLRRLSQVVGGKATAFARLSLVPQRTWLKLTLVVAACLALVLALARPRWGFDWTEVRRHGSDIVMVVDVSSSMLAQDVSPNRLERAKHELSDLLDLMTGDRVGLVAFAGRAFVQCPLTEDYGAVRLFLDYLDPELIPVQGTDIGGAVHAAVAALEAGEPDGQEGKAIILLSDGEDLAGHVGDATEYAKEKGVKVYTIGIGSPEGAPIPIIPEAGQAGGGFKKDSQGNVVITKPDERGLQQLALGTGGMYARSVAGGDGVARLYKEGIRRDVAQRDFQATRQRLWHERFQWFLAACLLCLVVEACVRDVRSAALLVLAASVLGAASPYLSAGALLWGLMSSPAVAQVVLEDQAARAKAQGSAGTSEAKGTPAAPSAVSQAASPPESKTEPEPLSSVTTRGDAPSLWQAHRAFERGDYEGAASGFAAAAKAGENTNSTLGHIYNRAVSQYRQGNYSDAALGFAQAAASGDKKLAERSYFNQGNAELARGGADAAIKAYENAIAMDPSDAEAQENLAYAKQVKEQQQKQQDQKQQQQGQKQQQQDQKQQQQDQKQQGQDQKQAQGQDQKQQEQDQTQGQAQEQKQQQDQNQAQAQKSPSAPEQTPNTPSPKQPSPNDKATADAAPAKPDPAAPEDKSASAQDAAPKKPETPQADARAPAHADAASAHPMTPDEAENVLRAATDQAHKYNNGGRQRRETQQPEKDW